MEERLKFLVNEFQEGQLADAEKEELLNLVHNHPTLVSNEIVSLIFEQETQPEQIDQKRWNPIVEKIISVDRPRESNRKSISIYIRWIAAAIFLVVLAVTYNSYKTTTKVHVFANDIAAGKNKAVLTLADGRKITLSDAADGALLKEAGLSVSKEAGGQLVYQVDSLTNNNSSSGFNTISTPNGGEWQIHLPDGTKVWLNAASTLVYPLNIAIATNRTVKLVGEAYFEVSKSASHPFIVETEKQKVQVLGTHFNVSGYLNEPTTSTTLLEGSVQVSALENPSVFKVLKPGQQALLSKKTITINTVDVEESVAWKNGYFMFNNERQESIMRKIARWYNVQVEYADPQAKDVVYYGTVSRFDKISQVLRKFEQTGEVRFEVEGNKLFVHKK